MKNNQIDNIADTTGRVVYKETATTICPNMEQLYFCLLYTSPSPRDA